MDLENKEEKKITTWQVYLDGAELTLMLDMERVWAHVWTGTGVCGDMEQPSPCS